MYLPWNASKARQREAEHARRNRADILTAFSHGKVTRRELIAWGLITAGGALALKNGLSPYARSVFASSNIPTGAPPSPLFDVRPFTQPLPRFDVLDRRLLSAHPLSPIPTERAFTPVDYPGAPLQSISALLGGGVGPVEGRPPGPDWAHQRFAVFPPRIGVEVTQEGARVGDLRPRFHPRLPDQDPEKLWTFNGTLPPKLVLARYGEPILFRHHNKLPDDITRNGGFGRHTITTHEHNGHHGAENDGFTGAFFFPGQYYDYHWPVVLAGHDTINTDASDPRAGTPTDNGVDQVPGDWHETMSTHWFHDHMFSFTAQNVYKGNAGMLNIYSALDRGNEAIEDGVNLRLPSGTAKSWGNLDYDVNLMLADKAWDRDGQLLFDIFEFDGFIGDAMTVNLAYKPYFEVERRKYRFRILNASVSRFFKLALSDGSELIQIGNDGNLLPHPVRLRQLDEQGIAERFDVVIDFSRYAIRDNVWLVNLCEHQDGRKPAKDLALAEALSGKSSDPCVGKFLEFRIVRDPATPDLSRVPGTLIPNPDLSKVPVARVRRFEFGRSGGSDSEPWTIRTDGGAGLAADYERISAAPRPGTREIWHLENGGGGWDHPIHIHFEEGQILARDGSTSKIPPWERGRKDVYRLRPGGSVTITMQFREFAGTFMEHCHNTMHEDHAMLLRWDLDRGLVPLPTPIPTPQGVTFIPSDVLREA